jgi:uncharacterized phage protein gp47/JayE
VGWTSVTNPSSASPGTAVETDSALRSRQAVSVANPSQAETTGILGGVLAVPGVLTATLYENDTGAAVNYINGSYNAAGFPAHSITVVVSGGVGQTVADTIFLRKTPGCYTNGDQVYDFTDQYGIVTPIRFYLVSPTTISLVISLTTLSNYNSAVQTTILNNVLSYINGLKIGQSVIISQIEYAVTLANAGQQYPYFTVNSITANGSSADLAMNFNQQPQTASAHITLLINGSNGAPEFQFESIINSQNIICM